MKSGFPLRTARSNALIRHLFGVVALLAGVYLLTLPALSAHGVSSKDARYLQSLNGPAIIPLMYLGAKHLVTDRLVVEEAKIVPSPKTK